MFCCMFSHNKQFTLIMTTVLTKCNGFFVGLDYTLPQSYMKIRPVVIQNITSSEGLIISLLFSTLKYWNIDWCFQFASLTRTNDLNVNARTNWTYWMPSCLLFSFLSFRPEFVMEWKLADPLLTTLIKPDSTLTGLPLKPTAYPPDVPWKKKDMFIF